MPYPAKRFVYIIRSVHDPARCYIGLSADVRARRAHNAGQNQSKALWKPWLVNVTIEFGTERMAVRFEKYQSRAGHAFVNRHLVDQTRAGLVARVVT